MGDMQPRVLIWLGDGKADTALGKLWKGGLHRGRHLDGCAVGAWGWDTVLRHYSPAFPETPVLGFAASLPKWVSLSTPSWEVPA